MNEVKLIRKQLIDEINEQISSAQTVYILVSFAMKSGVEMLLPSLQEAAERGADIKICTGDYLYVTQPEALRSLLKIGGSASMRMWQSNGESFHPKVYIFENGTARSLYVGSSNMSRSALTDGIEWNLGVSGKEADPAVAEAIDEFHRLFYDSQTVPLNEQTIASYEKIYNEKHAALPEFVKRWTETEETSLMFDQQGNQEVIRDPKADYDSSGITTIEPRGPQIDALHALENTFAEGYDKAMAVLATGLGKTYLAGFFAQKFERILFVAHREEILLQAEKSFAEVMPERTSGIVNGKQKETDREMVFASVFTLANEKQLQDFSPDAFDLIVVDEFHHAAADTYNRVLDYFNPAFLLGLTATPYRMDGKDVFAICEGNVAFQMHFIEAIQIQWLTPFRYYGVYDDTDYSQITWLGTQYHQKELEANLLREDLAARIYNEWQRYKQTRTLGFCSSIKQVEFLAAYFQEQGVRVIGLHSQTANVSRQEAIRLLENDEVEVIFTVDLFNEGTDIPSVDTLLFTRPTESLTVFTQQVGRGLRLADHKESCVIIDLIGNYRNADLKLSLLDTRPLEEQRKSTTIMPQVPESCTISFDTAVIDLLKEIKKKAQPRKEKIRALYEQLKEEFGRRPSYLELYRHKLDSATAIRSEFGSFPSFLHWAGELSAEEEQALTEGKTWLDHIEKTGMSKSYKMVVLRCMLARGIDRWLEPATPKEIAPCFYEFLSSTPYRRNDISAGDKDTWNRESLDKVAKRIADMPMTKFGGPTAFDGEKLTMDVQLTETANPLVYSWTEEICEFRLETYFERKYGGV
ncbi:DEAD/DEAH box helicase family protein [Salisediminibacterium halotolerans]|uniref:Superfamily II DNA or RNA helicase n=1 Tax=Salisediminibacterium halotolerans TaxID=517425 RepID=A0A1H9RBK5_9BACI|nr:DEAD/DEAH box helicase family protein [Salisediminibacterium haloalkalitolerans]SER70311.1 Superfamily II DNA or RNA helicase [Salisediminibacterium haloalkalitolerans]